MECNDLSLAYDDFVIFSRALEYSLVILRLGSHKDCFD